MATKAQAKQVEVAPQVKAEPKKAAKPQWEYKDRDVLFNNGKVSINFYNTF